MQYTQIPQSIFQLQLPIDELGVLCHMIHAYDITARKLWYSEDKLASNIGISARTLSRYKTALTKKGVICLLKKGNQYTKSSHYDIPLYHTHLDAVGALQTTTAQPQILATQPKASKTPVHTPEEQAVYDAWLNAFPDSGLKLTTAFLAKIRELGKDFFYWYISTATDKGLKPRTQAYITPDDVAEYKTLQQQADAIAVAKQQSRVKRMTVATVSITPENYKVELEKVEDAIFERGLWPTVLGEIKPVLAEMQATPNNGDGWAYRNLYRGCFDFDFAPVPERAKLLDILDKYRNVVSVKF